ncbi:phosphonoacetaldehyde hydrolase [Helicobacter sp. 13S00477-4]|uniref:phosphonoacetaldehyde hydrolase n=1 Tax=Helicobacter sp. 13S00477-4 TaxID=1905759 RepID=UPI000BA4E709|nr:phosphonoacetaldehyde hydrolase [Helicobacter sp. 13S00477-4]PAF52845.1 phosphonoacetaldehyde hydrolase [Helicobacter sp. 13S00477-4]
MKIQAVIFDWAGTTIDYGCFSPLGAFVKSFDEEGILLSIQEARKPMGLLKIDHIRALLKMPEILGQFLNIYGYQPKEEDILRIYERFEKNIFEVLSDHVILNPYVFETTKELEKMGIKIGSTTGYTKSMMEIVLPLAKDQGYVPECCVASDELGYGRPYPYMMYECARRLNVYPQNSMIKVGDTSVDIEEGKNAGCVSVGIVYGGSVLGLSVDEVARYPQKDLQFLVNQAKIELYDAGADYVIDDMRDLLPIIEKIQQKA